MFTEPYNEFGIECGKGWLSIIKPIIKWIEEYNTQHPKKQIIIEQIKQKFGELRFYVSWAPDELLNMIVKAEEEALQTCELCGSKKNVGTLETGWITTICWDCLIKQCLKPDKTVRWYSNDENRPLTVSMNKEGVVETFG